MILHAEITVHGEWLDGDGGFLLWGVNGGGKPVDVEELRVLLFGWHAPLFYGALLEVREAAAARPDAGRAQGLLVPAAAALEYLAAPSPLLHSKLRWSAELAPALEAAPLLCRALANGWAAPDYGAWLAGRGLRAGLRLPAEAEPQWASLQARYAPQAVATVERWLDRAVRSGPGPDGPAEWRRLAAVLAVPQAAAGAREVAAARSAGAGAAAPERGGGAGPGAARRLGAIPGGAAAGAQARGGGAVDAGYAGVDAAAAILPTEEEWLEAIGWITDAAPFRPALYLLEPDRPEAPWKLAIQLESIDEPKLQLLCDWDGFPLPAAAEDHKRVHLPPKWEPHLESRLSREKTKWLRCLPWLAASEEELLPFHTEHSSITEAEHAPRFRSELTDQEAFQLLTEGVEALLAAGASIVLPPWWEEAFQTKTAVRATMLAGSGPSMFSAEQLIRFDWRVSLGETELSADQFQQLLDQKRNLIQVDGKWLALPPAMLTQLKRQIKRFRSGMRLGEALALQARQKYGVHPVSATDAPQMHVDLTEELQHRIGRLEQQSMPLVEPPFTLQATLRPYQMHGSSWLLYLSTSGLGGILADDMGLGKSIQLITYLLHRKERGDLWDAPALLICPTSVLGNWQKEFERFAPSLRVALHYGANRPKGAAFSRAANEADVILTSYTLAQLDEEELCSIEWTSVCLDEAQNIKNPHAKQTAAIKRIPARHRIALTGTPVENRLAELWSIFDFINPGYLGTLSDFHSRYTSQVERTGDDERTLELQQLIRPFLLRRVKQDPAIQLDLPEKQENNVYVRLTPEQAALYEGVLDTIFTKIDTLPPMERRGLILSSLTKLKQICGHPSLFLGDADPEAPLPERSDKLLRLMEMVQEARDQKERALIFTQYIQMGHLIQHTLEEALQENVAFLHGGLSKTARDQMIADFQSGQGASIFVLSLKAGGTGLNLTAANHVFHYDRWWNPAVENQATDRAYRIGQQRDVQVHKFVTLGTLEERIDEMIQRKQHLSLKVVGSGEQWLTELTTTELKDLLTLRSVWLSPR
nr:DEAD/DEAH box helicase [Paenibacillus turpanensis]